MKFIKLALIGCLITTAVISAKQIHPRDLPKQSTNITDNTLIMLPQSGEKAMYVYSDGKKKNAKIYRILLTTSKPKANGKVVVNVLMRNSSMPKNKDNQEWRNAFAIDSLTADDIKNHRVGLDGHVIFRDENNDGNFSLQFPGDNVTVNK